MTALVLAHMAATWAMVGFAWTIQILHYPLMRTVPLDAFPGFEKAHQRRVISVIAIFGPIEVITAAAVWLAVEAVPRWMSLGSGLLLVGVWASTGLFFAPLHGRLASGFDPALHRRLVRSNWLRTVAWTARGAAAAAMVAFV